MGERRKERIAPKYRKVRKRIKAALDKWMQPMGLCWWHVVVIYMDHLPKIPKGERGKGYGNPQVVGKAHVDWRYGRAYIEVSLREFSKMTRRETEVAIVHEPTHVLVNEMRENDIDHEERVVTNLTKAFFWVRVADKEA